MTATLALSGTETRHSADGCKGARVGTDPIAKRLRPGSLDVGEARGTHHRDEDLCLAHLAGQPVDDHRYRVAGVVDEQLVATHVGLTHRDRELGFPASVQLAETGIAVALRMALDVLVPEDRQRDVLALELPVDGRPTARPDAGDLASCRRRQTAWPRARHRSAPRAA